MKFKIITEKGSIIEMESGLDVDVTIDDQDFTISIKQHGNI